MTIASSTSTESPSVDFSLSEEQEAIRDAARDFARGEIDPIVDEIDEAQRFPKEIFDKLGELESRIISEPADTVVY